MHMSPDIRACLIYVCCKLHIFLSKSQSGMQSKLLFAGSVVSMGDANNADKLFNAN